MKPLRALRIAAILLAVAPVAQARDVETEQARLEYARQQMESAKSDYNADVRQTAETRKALAQQKAKLEREQKKATQSRKRYLDAKARYRKARATLDKEWKRQ